MDFTTKQTNRALIIFVKYPELGKVKTRLASATNNNFALEVYKKLAENIFVEINTVSAEVFVFFDNSTIEKNIKNWVSRDFVYSPQIGNDLGQKMFNAFSKVSSMNYQKIIIIGSDIPDINQNIIEDAFHQLEKNDVVISPSDDGGYSLLGINKVYPFLFENIEWSSEKVLSKTIEQINSHKLSYSILNILNDIDTIDELKFWLNNTKNKNLKNDIIQTAKRNGISL